MYECRRNIKEFSMKMIQFLKKELKEEISDNPWAFYVITFMTVPTVLVSIACYFDSMEQERHEQTSNEKGVQKRLTVKFNGRSYYISDSKRKVEKSREKADE